MLQCSFSFFTSAQGRARSGEAPSVSRSRSLQSAGHPRQRAATSPPALPLSPAHPRHSSIPFLSAAADMTPGREADGIVSSCSWNFAVCLALDGLAVAPATLTPLFSPRSPHRGGAGASPARCWLGSAPGSKFPRLHSPDPSPASITRSFDAMQSQAISPAVIPLPVPAPLWHFAGMRRVPFLGAPPRSPCRRSGQHP